MSKAKKSQRETTEPKPQGNVLSSSILRNLDTFRRAHEAGNPFGLIDAIIYCDELSDHVPGLSLPRWALRALARESIAQLKEEKLHKRMGSSAKILTEHKRRHVDYSRYEAVRGAFEHGFNWRPEKDAFEKAVELCEGTPAEAKTDMMRNSYFRVKRLLKENPGKFYLSMYSRHFVPKFGKVLIKK